MNPDRWPLNPYLPLKRPSETPGAFPDCAVMLAGSPSVYRTTLDDLATMTDAERSRIDVNHYSDYDAVIDAGWMVD